MKTSFVKQTKPVVAGFACAAALFCGTAWLPAAEEMKMPEPLKEHQWLDRFVGEWESEGQCYMKPEAPEKMTGTEETERLGAFWTVTKGNGAMGDMKVSYILTLGYDAAKSKYVGTWVDSMTGTLWVYEGTVSEDGNTLTLETEGPCPMHGGKVMSFKEVTEFKGPDEKVFTSSMKGADGEWTKVVSIISKRKK